MIQAVTRAFSDALSAVVSFVPNLVGFLVILLVGWLVGLGVGKGVTLLLRKVGFDRLTERIGWNRLEQRMGFRIDEPRILGKLAFWFIFLIFLVPAVNALGLATVSNTLNAIIAYLPSVFVAIVVLTLGSLVAVLVSDMIRGASRAAHFGNPNVIASIVRWTIIGFATLVALQILQIAPALINILFAAVTIGLALAFGLAFGLGGRESAQRLLSRTEGRIMASQGYEPEQIVQQARTDLAHSERIGERERYVPPSGTPSAEQTSERERHAAPTGAQTYGTTGYDQPGYESPRNPTSGPQRTVPHIDSSPKRPPRQ